MFAVLFATIVVGQIVYERNFWLIGVCMLVVVLASKDLKRPLLALAFGLPFLQIQRGDLYLYMVAPPLEVAVLTLMLVWFVRAAQRRVEMPSWGPLESSLALFLVLAAGSAIFAILRGPPLDGVGLSAVAPATVAFRTTPLSPLFPARQFLLFLEGFLLFWFVRSNLNRNDVVLLVVVLLESALIVMMASFFVFITLDLGVFYGGVNRATGVFTGPNQFGTYLLMFIPVLISGLVQPRWLAWVLASGAVGLLLLTRSEGAMVAALATAGLGLLVRSAKLPAIRTLAVVAAIVAATGVGLVLTTIPAERLNEVSDGRYFLFQAGLRMVRESPWFGVGLGTFYRDLGSFYPAGAQGREVHAHAHNLYLQIVAELGLPGFLAFLRPFWILAVRVRQVPSLSPIQRGLLAGVVAVLLHSLTDYTLWIAPVWLLFWIYVGALSVATNSERSHPGAVAAGDLAG
jgi:O-antigen ligase